MPLSNNLTFSKDYWEEMTHKGKVFAITGSFLISATSEFIIAGEVGNKYVHMIPPIVKTSKEDVDINAYEYLVFSGGANKIIFNRSRPHRNILSTWGTLSVGVTVSNFGTCFYEDYVAGGTDIGGVSYGGANEAIKPWTLDKNTKYALRLFNNSSNDNKTNVFLEWMETDNL